MFFLVANHFFTRFKKESESQKYEQNKGDESMMEILGKNKPKNNDQ